MALEPVNFRTAHKALIAEEAAKAGVSQADWLNEAILAKANNDILREQLAAAQDRERLLLTLVANTAAIVDQLAVRAELDFDAVNATVDELLTSAGYELDKEPV